MCIFAKNNIELAYHTNHNMTQIKERLLPNITKWFLGIIAVLGFIFTIYIGFIKKTAPQFEYDILSATDFFNSSEPVTNIKIIIDSTDVQENSLNISTYIIKAENKGNAHITQKEYGGGFWGLKINNGELLESPLLLECSSEYLSNMFHVDDSLKGSSLIPLPALPLDIDDYYIFKIIVLHGVDSLPSFQPEGKISGQKNIAINEAMPNNPNIFTIAFGGNWLAHIIRFITYSIVFILLMFGIIFITEKFDDWKAKRNRKAIIKEFTKHKNILPFIKEDFINKGEYIVEQLNEIYQFSEDELNKKYQKSKRFLENKNTMTKNNREQFHIHRNRIDRINNYIEKGYLILSPEEDLITFNMEAKKSIKELYKIIETQGLLLRQRRVQIGENEYIVK